jgi:hypothetical protein
MISFNLFENILVDRSGDGRKCDSRNLLQSSMEAALLFRHFGKDDCFIGVADLLAGHDLLHLLGQSTTAFPHMIKRHTIIMEESL